MRVLIVGLGSIAQKHIHALRKIEPDIQLVALRTGKSKNNLAGVTNIYHIAELEQKFDFAIISNPSTKHLESIKDLMFLKIPLFIEKPPLASLEGAGELVAAIEKEQIITYTAFNLRFHPVLQWVRNNIADKRVLEVQAYCGSYLPKWRPQADYRNVYSAKKELGGGVHLDLIHELDYVSWIFGRPQSVQGYISKVSDLEIDVPDVAHYWLQYEKMVASIILNYYRRDSKRTLEIVFEDLTWTVDLINNKVCDASGSILFEALPSVLHTYEEQMLYFINCLKSGSKPMNSIDEALHTLEMSLNIRQEKDDLRR
ncbi:oxidoreductase domain-containing protein [Flammeovirgaceae bacterium 311]|nr:oxidoreductase domain-containing protein [Flammeovirgaceae bacterium 311]